MDKMLEIRVQLVLGAIPAISLFAAQHPGSTSIRAVAALSSPALFCWTFDKIRGSFTILLYPFSFRIVKLWVFVFFLFFFHFGVPCEHEQ